MKYVKNLMIMLFLSLITFGLLDVNAATAPNEITIKSKSSLYYYTERNNTDYISGYNFYRKELTDSTLGYCVSNINTSVPAGRTLTVSGPITDKGLDYIIKNGYPHKTFTGDEKKDYYITQSAIWAYYDEVYGSRNWGRTTFTSSDTGMKEYVYKLVQGAKNANSKETVGSSITISINDTNMTLSEDSKYFVSDLITVKLTNTKSMYTVNLEDAPSGTILKNENNEEKTKFTKGEKFRIYIPVSEITESGSIKISVSTNGVTKTTYRYTSNISGYQDIAPVTIYETLTKMASKKITLKYSYDVTKLKISKQDITSKKELKGATLVIKDKTGKIVDSWVSSDTPHYVEGLEPGIYTLTEEIAPNGYKLSSETITFELKRDGKVKTVVMYNSKETVVTKVKISKQDITSKEELPGAKLIVKDENNNIVASFISESTPHYIEGLKAGTYTLTEEIAPEGYKLSSETIKFEVKSDGTISSVVMYNEKYTEVPITDLNISTISIIGATILMILGGGVVFYAKRNF